MLYWAIWDKDAKDWVREMPSKVDDGGQAVLAYRSKQKAEKRAAKHFGYYSYTLAKKDGHCEVRQLGYKARR